MPATLHRFRSRPQRARQSQTEQLRQLLLGIPGLPEGPVGAIITSIDGETAAENGWTFVMLSPAQNKAVVRWLTLNSERPQKAVLLWAEMFEHLRRDTGEIMLTREEMARLIDDTTKHVSEITSDLVSIKALIRERDGRGFRYFMNPHVATHLPKGKREPAQAKAPPLELLSKDERKEAHSGALPLQLVEPA